MLRPACTLFGVILLVCCALASAADATDMPTFEAEPVLDAAELVSPALLNGPSYQVDSEVQVIGYHARFKIRTPYGEIPAESVEMLGVRIAEMPAVEALHQSDISAILARATGEATLAAGASLARIATRPVATIIGIPRGVARYFSRQWNRLDARVTRLGDSAHRRIAEDGNPYGDAEGPMTSTRVTDREARRWYHKPAREAEGLVRGELGYGKARRALAQSLGIDPATSNPLLVPRLDALAWARASGSKVGSIALGGLDEVSETLADVAQVDEVVWTLDPQDLRARNDVRLAPWCQHEMQRRQFLRHGAFTPTLQTHLADLIHELAPAHGCEALLDVALMAGSEVEARFIINALQLTRAHLGATATGIDLIPIGAALAIRSRDGEWLLPLPVDFLTWSEEIQQFFDQMPNQHGERTVLVSGTISLRAQRELTQRGFSLISHLPYPGAPPYAASPTRPDAMAAAILM